MTFDDAEFGRFLSDISDPFISGDIVRWRLRILTPFSLVTKDGPVTLRTEKDIEKNFHHYRAAVAAMRLDLVARQPLRIEPCEDGTVLATYRTELLCGAERATAPYTATALLHPTPDGWRMSAIMNARGHHEWTGVPPLSRETNNG